VLRRPDIRIDTRGHRHHKIAVTIGIVTTAVIATAFPNLQVHFLPVYILSNLLWIWGE
jgi:hypothetical protein